MPKGLSLKKVQSQGTNNQKSITQFFKVPPKGKKSSDTFDEIKLGKRKASSPAQEERHNLKNSPVKENLDFHIFKKCKVDQNTKNEESILEEYMCKESSIKRNDAQESSDDCAIGFQNIPNSIKTKNRSPLSNIDHGILKNAKSISPDKVVSNGNDYEMSKPIKVLRTPEKIHKSSKKSCSPNSSINKSLTNSVGSPSFKEFPLQLNECSPSKCGSTVRVLEFEQNGSNVDDLFDEEWGIEETDEDCKEDLDLSSMQRCEILSVASHPMKLELRLKNDLDNRCTCFVEGVWINTPLKPGEIVSILARKNEMGQFTINNTYGLLSLRPDHLISTTSVVAGVFCKRKAVLQERWKGIDSANTAMTIGILIHELVQKALTQHIAKVTDLRAICDELIKQSTHMLYDAGICEKEARNNMEMYITPLADFMQLYMSKNQLQDNKKAKWNGHIDEVLDIEENVCCPKLGLKGKIDVTLQVTIHERSGKKREIMPLELKSGRASGSAEHRGQLVLYGMMLSLQRKEDPIVTLQRGLLLYLKEQVDVREVSCGYPERRDLIMLRNELVQHLAAGPNDTKTDELLDIEDASKVLQQSLPDPVHHEGACTKCPYLTLCSIHLWHTNDVKVSESHPLTKLRNIALGHLESTHVTYFLHWTSLLKLEEKAQISNSPLHSLWTDGVEKRAKRGACAANLTLQSVKLLEDRYAHVFERTTAGEITSAKTNDGPKEGEFSIVSIDDRPWIAAGVVSVANQKEIHIVLERNLGLRLSKATKFHIDTYESHATTVQNLTNLGVLMEDSDRALRLRKLIIDKEPPVFTQKLPREVGRLGSKLMRGLNIEQQRAVLKALAANDYALLQGLPGTGKTQTISVLIQMLVALKQRVLVTAHTHSAVDTVLTRLPESVRVMRLGSASRVSHKLLDKTETTLTKTCTTSEELAKIYDSMEVIGVTCLGANHALLSKTTFDVCIVDEATQVLQCTVLRPLFAAKRFVLVGDPEQLPPVVKSKPARRLGMEESLFHRLMSEESTSTLRLQYRMNQALVDIANKVAYNQRLKCANQSVAESKMNIDINKISNSMPWIKTACSVENDDVAIFFNMEATKIEQGHKVLTNIDEACVVYGLVEALTEGGVKTSDIGVIAPYRDQVSLLHRSLTSFKIEVSTVDQFQGRDKSVIIYSCTKRESRDDKVKDGEVLNDQRRLAVSVTRAKHKFIAIGNQRVLRRYKPLSQLIDACKVIQLEQTVVVNLLVKYKDCVK
ncbi:DNA replication ATP-dependent helicase/nuclease DNA2 [Zerene cesonia]|uniref:DNA replication ATP-dependent helicase/nuclease DNA2 n=1 Tax=Zerene cesonia TaxID=33412 RepID=UPI0018E51C95|nr:DNA replication ATP-dependent helicase/nuclease DNA2 [Zerene cesonia]